MEPDKYEDKHEEVLNLLGRVREYHAATPSIVRALDIAIDALREKQQCIADLRHSMEQPKDERESHVFARLAEIEKQQRGEVRDG